jgi:sugar O-acyltransferase (sialic acid O-acetyltransferase NeuD family)
MLTKPLFVLGSGGHAKVVVSTLLVCGVKIAGILDDNPHTWGSHLLGISVLGSTELLDEKTAQAVIAIGSNSVRKAIAAKFSHIDWLTVVHPRAYVDASVTLGKGCVVFAGAVIQPGSRIYDHVIVNTCASIDHDCSIDSFVHVGPGAHLAGNVHAGQGAFIGIGGCVIQGKKVGEWSTIGSGSVVIKDIPPNITAVGVPARIIKQHLDSQ